MSFANAERVHIPELLGFCTFCMLVRFTTSGPLAVQALQTHQSMDDTNCFAGNWKKFVRIPQWCLQRQRAITGARVRHSKSINCSRFVEAICLCFFAKHAQKEKEERNTLTNSSQTEPPPVASASPDKGHQELPLCQHLSSCICARFEAFSSKPLLAEDSSGLSCCFDKATRILLILKNRLAPVHCASPLIPEEARTIEVFWPLSQAEQGRP